MKRILNILLIFIVIGMSFVVADSVDPIQEGSIDPEVKDAQEGNADPDLQEQLETEKEIFLLKKEKLLDISDEIFKLIIGVFKLGFDLLLLIIIFIEMRISIWIFSKAIPKAFNAISDGVANFFNNTGVKNE